MGDIVNENIELLESSDPNDILAATIIKIAFETGNISYVPVRRIYELLGIPDPEPTLLLKPRGEKVDEESLKKIRQAAHNTKPDTIPTEEKPENWDEIVARLRERLKNEG